jgi:hypothetical protein
MGSALCLMAFLCVASAGFFGLDALMQGWSIGPCGQRMLVAAGLLVLVVAFGLMFGFDGYVIPDWEDRARR